MAFDLTVQVRDKKGNIVKVQPYKLVIENGMQKFERPVGSGIWYDAGGTLISKPEVKAEQKKDEKPSGSR